MRTKMVDGVEVNLTAAENAQRDAKEAAEAAKPKPEKAINIKLTRDEEISRVDHYESVGIISTERADKLKE